MKLGCREDLITRAGRRGHCITLAMENQRKWGLQWFRVGRGRILPDTLVSL